jgi:hypothetical protein
MTLIPYRKEWLKTLRCAGLRVTYLYLNGYNHISTTLKGNYNIQGRRGNMFSSRSYHIILLPSLVPINQSEARAIKTMISYANIPFLPTGCVVLAACDQGQVGKDSLLESTAD